MPNIEIGGVNYYYRDEGHGSSVILAHADGSSSGQWKSLIEKLSPAYRTLAFDLSGQGRSGTWPEDTPYTFAAEANAICALADLAAGPVHLVGHSVGGSVTLKAALRLSDRVASVTLIEPTPFHLLHHHGESEAYAEIKGIADAFVERVERGEKDKAMADFVKYWTDDDGWNSIPEERRAPLLAATAKICLEWNDGLSDSADLSVYGQLETPTLLIRGTRTTLPAGRVAALLHGAIGGARLVEIEGAGHMSPVTHAEAVNGAVAEHIRANSS